MNTCYTKGVKMFLEGTLEYEILQLMLESTQDENTEYANGIADFCSWLLGELPSKEFKFSIEREEKYD